jgi:hypothetical protein
MERTKVLINPITLGEYVSSRYKCDWHSSLLKSSATADARTVHEPLNLAKHQSNLPSQQSCALHVL